MNIERILDKLHISELNQMQQETCEAVLHTNKDVVVLSPTGTGKTLAYLLPVVQALHQTPEALQSVVSEAFPTDVAQPSVLVVVPGRELALQSAEVLKSMGTGLRTMALYGGRPTMDEHRELRKAMPHVVFATPGRINDHIDKGNVLAESIRWLIIDEFDKCLAMGFQQEMSRLAASLPRVSRRILLSATESEAIPRFVNMGRTLRIDYRSNEEEVAERIRIFRVVSPTKDKLSTLRNLLLDFGGQSTVVFLNYRDSVERTAAYLRGQGFTVSLFHGGLEQRQREDALYKFANGSANILVATDLASRGLDIPDIDNIVHYHLPETEDNYKHRIGRTARWDKQGRAFFIVSTPSPSPKGEGSSQISPAESSESLPYIDLNSLPLYTPLSLWRGAGGEAFLPRMVTLYIGKGKRDKLSKGDIVGFLCKKGGLRSDEIGKISVEERFTYVAIVRQRLREVLRRVQGEKIKGIKTIVEEVKD